MYRSADFDGYGKEWISYDHEPKEQVKLLCSIGENYKNGVKRQKLGRQLERIEKSVAAE